MGVFMFFKLHKCYQITQHITYETIFLRSSDFESPHQQGLCSQNSTNRMLLRDSHAQDQFDSH